MKKGSMYLRNIFWATLLTAGLLFNACTQSQQGPEETGKGLGGEPVADPCTSEQNQENPLCRWAITKMIMDAKASDQGGTLTGDVEYDSLGRITHIVMTADPGGKLYEYSKTYDDKGRVKTFQQHLFGTGDTTEETYDYNANDEISTKTTVQTHHDPNDSLTPLSPITTAYTYSYKPNSTLEINGEQTDKDHNPISTSQENQVFNQDGKILSKETFWQDNSGTTFSWYYTSNTFSNKKLLNSTSSQQYCSTHPCDPSKGIGSMQPDYIQKVAQEFDPDGRPKGFSTQSIYPPLTDPSIEMTCQFQYDITSPILLVPDHPLVFLEPDLEIITPSPDYLITGFSCLGYTPDAQGTKTDLALNVEFKLKRLYQALGMSSPS